MSRPVQYDFDPWFQQFYEDVTLKCAKALRVKDPALILQVEPAPGIEAAAASLISPNDMVLNLASGVYGKGFGYWSARYHKDMVEIEVPYNEAIDPGQVADAFRKRPDIKVVSLVHHDTPSGTINPAREIGKIVREHDGAADRRCRLVLRRHGHPSRRLLRRHLHHRPRQVPGRRARPHHHVRDAIAPGSISRPTRRRRSPRCSASRTGRTPGARRSRFPSRPRSRRSTASTARSTSISMKGRRTCGAAMRSPRAPAAPASRRWVWSCGPRPRASPRPPAPPCACPTA